MDKQSKWKDYQHRKWKDDKKKENFKAQTREEKDEVREMIESRSAKNLLEFMEDRYEDLIQKNPKLITSVYKAFLVKFETLAEQYENKQIERLRDFYRIHTSRQLKPEQIKEIKKAHAYKENCEEPRMSSTSVFNSDLSRHLVVTINGNVRKFNPQKEGLESKMVPVTVKRLKKEVISNLNGYINYCEMSDKILGTH